MTTGVELIAAVNDDIQRVTGDVADDTAAFYDTASARGATVALVHSCPALSQNDLLATRPGYGRRHTIR